MLSTPVRPLAWKTPAAMISIAMLTSPAIVMAITTSMRSNRKIAPALLVRSRRRTRRCVSAECR